MLKTQENNIVLLNVILVRISDTSTATISIFVTFFAAVCVDGTGAIWSAVSAGTL